MKIIHFTHELPEASGVATFVKELSKSLQLLECKSENVKCKERVESEIVLEAKELPREPEPGTILHIHGMWLKPYHQAAKWARKAGVPVVWSTHGMTAPWSMAHKRWKKLIAWWLYQKWDLRRAAVIHSTVEQERDWNRALGLGRQVVAPLGTSLPEKILTQRHEGTEKTLLFVGRVYPVKALDRLIEAFARANVTDWKLRIVGPDQAGHMAELKSLCDSLGVPYIDETSNDSSLSSCEAGAKTNRIVRNSASVCGKIIFAGPKFGEELEAEYENCDCLALVSHTENFGATVVDAMAHGKPVITSTATPWSEVENVGGERCGWWVDNDVETLGKTILEMMSLSDAERAEMGRRGRKLVEEKYTWEAVAKKMIETYKGVIQ